MSGKENSDYISHYHKPEQLIDASQYTAMRDERNPNPDPDVVPPLRVLVTSFFPSAIPQMSEMLDALGQVDSWYVEYYGLRTPAEREALNNQSRETGSPAYPPLESHRVLHIEINHFPHAGTHGIPGEIELWFDRGGQKEQLSAQALEEICSDSTSPEVNALRSQLREALLRAVELKQPIEELYREFLEHHGGVLDPNQARINIYLPQGTTVTTQELFQALYPNGGVTFSSTHAVGSSQQGGVNESGILTIHGGNRG